MRSRLLVIATGAALVAALAVGVMVGRGSFDGSGDRVGTSASAAGSADAKARSSDALRSAAADASGSATAEASSATGVADASRLAALSTSPEARAALAAQAERERFETALRDFLANANALDAAERARIAAELDARVEAEELAARMSADEARLVRLRLIELGTADADERVRRAEALADAYRRDAERRQRAFETAQARDPSFVAYKAREAQVVAEVDAMHTIPGGLSRDEYLRQRLQAERERAYATRPGG